MQAEAEPWYRNCARTACSDPAGSVYVAESVCAPAAVDPLARAEGRPRSLVLVKGADHFFTGRLKVLQDVIRGHYHPLVRRLDRSGGV